MSLTQRRSIDQALSSFWGWWATC